MVQHINALGPGTQGVQYFDGTITYTGITGTIALPLVSNNASSAPSYQVLTPAGGGTGSSTAFTAGSVVFAGTSGVYAQDNANFFWDDTNNLLGIGTNTPNSGIPTRLRITNTSSSIRTSLNIAGTLTTSSGTPTGILLDGTFSPSIGGQAIAINTDCNFASAAATTLSGICYYASPAFTGNAGTLTAYGFFYDGGGPLVGTIDFQWGGYFMDPTAGSVKMALYAASMSIGSYNFNQPPSNGLIVSGTCGFGTNSPTSNNQVQITSTLAHGLQINGTQVNVDGASHLHALNANGVYAPTSGASLVSTFDASAVFQIPTGQTVTSAASVHASPSFTSNLGTITTMYGIWYDGGGSLPGGTITTAYGGYFAVPTAGTNKISLYSGNLAIGSYTGTVPPSNGLIVSGNSGIGTSSPQNKLDVSGALAIGSYGGVNTAPSNGLIVSGSVGFGVSSVSARFHLSSPSTSTSNNYSSYNSGEIISTQTNYNAAWATDTFISPSGALSFGASIIVFPKFAPSGSIAVAAGIYIEAGSGSGTLTNGYGIYVENPTFGTGKYAAYFGGAVGIGTTTPNAASALEVSSTTQGIRFPNMTTTQKNAMANVAGMVIFDTTLGKLCVNTGAAWQTITSV